MCAKHFIGIENKKLSFPCLCAVSIMICEVLCIQLAEVRGTRQLLKCPFVRHKGARGTANLRTISTRRRVWLGILAIGGSSSCSSSSCVHQLSAIFIIVFFSAGTNAFAVFKLVNGFWRAASITATNHSLTARAAYFTVCMC